MYSRILLLVQIQPLLPEVPAIQVLQVVISTHLAKIGAEYPVQSGVDWMLIPLQKHLLEVLHYAAFPRIGKED